MYQQLKYTKSFQDTETHHLIMARDRVEYAGAIVHKHIYYVQV